MAETVHLTLLANGVQIEGDSTETSLDRENTIQCVAFEDSGRRPTDASSGRASGRRVYQPLRIVKAVDRATPLLAKAFANIEQVRGTFRFYRPNPNGDGTTQQFFTVDILDGTVVSVRHFVLDILDAASATRPPLEEVMFTFRTIRWTWEDGGIVHEDSWSVSR